MKNILLILSLFLTIRTSAQSDTLHFEKRTLETREELYLLPNHRFLELNDRNDITFYYGNWTTNEKTLILQIDYYQVFDDILDKELRSKLEFKKDTNYTIEYSFTNQNTENIELENYGRQIKKWTFPVGNVIEEKLKN